jgi:uncharacterized protein YkwD
MARAQLCLGVLLTFTLVAGGCPLGGESGLITVPSSGSSSTASDGSSGTSGSTTQGTQDSSDELVDLYPSCAEATQGDAWREEILRLVNVERARAGLRAVVRDQTLEDQATKYACEMIHYDFFAHENPYTGSQLADRAAEFGYDYYMIGENLAAGQATPAQVMADWMESAGHRANILEASFVELGVGVRTGGTYGTYWVQEFGRPAP